MNLATKIACRTLGAAGMGVALFDAMQVSGQFARNESNGQQQKYLENAFYNARTVDRVSFSNNSIRKNTFD